jgi:site-specific recombinase XerD
MQTPEPASGNDTDPPIDGWVISLRAAKKSPDTIKTYRKNIGLFLAWAHRNTVPAVPDLATVEAYLAEVCDTRSGGTGRAHLVALRSWAKWLVRERELDAYTLAEAERPTVDEKVVEPFTDEELTALLKACDGRRLMDLRDKAIIRLLIDCGGRAKEIVNIGLAEIDLPSAIALLHGKGAKDRFIPLSDETCEAIDRYIRARRKHRLADSPQLWLGDHAPWTFGYAALWKTMKGRGQLAGIANVHPHRFRHTFADRWLDRGGTEGGLMKVAGWSDPAMVRRYAEARAGKRALAEARRLNLSEL